jgi:hypothetical protein
MGLTFHHPDNWQVTDAGQISLVPPDCAMNAQGAEEFYLVNATRLQGTGITDPTDPQIPQWFDKLMANSALAGARRTRFEPVTIGVRQGAVIEWVLNRLFRRTYVTVSEQWLLHINGLGSKENVERRTEVMKKVFTSLRMGSGQMDRQLVGRWSHVYTAASTTAETIREFRADGTFIEGSEAAFSVRHHDEGGYQTGTTTGTSGRGGASTGRWSAGNGVLVLMYDDGSSAQFEYYVDGNSLMLGRGENAKLWERLR